MPRSLATATSAAVTARTWVTPPGTPVGAGRGEGLHRVEHEQARLDRVEVAEHRGQVGLGGQVEPLVQGADPFGPQPHLADRLLAADHQRRACRRAGRPLLGHVEQQGGLADAGLAGEQHHRAGDQAAAEHPVELGHAGRPGPGRRGADRRRSGGPARRGAGSGRHAAAPGAERRGGGSLDDRAPLAALRAPPHPAIRYLAEKKSICVAGHADISDGIAGGQA